MVLVAPDKLKGTMSASDAASTMSRALQGLGVRVETCPLSDGGEGFLDAFGGANRHSLVKGPLGKPIEAGWRLDESRAIIEMAQASGLVPAGGPMLNRPEDADTYGTGQLVAEALDAGARHIIIGLGGSASTDGGRGCISALESRVPFPPSVQVTVAADVTIRFLNAARVFAPQKGASAAAVIRLTRRLEREAEKLEARFHRSPLAVEGGGAAGGLAGALWAAGGTIKSGFGVVAKQLQLARAVSCADLVVSSEGYLDSTSFDGKAIGSMIRMCSALRQELGLVVGDADEDLLASLNLPVVALRREFGLDAAMGDAKSCLKAGTTMLLTRTNLGRHIANRGANRGTVSRRLRKQTLPSIDWEG
jgi:glycerate kinase